MAATSAVAPATLAGVAAALRRRLSLVLGVVVVALAVGLGAAQLLPTPLPTATVGIEIRPTGMDLSQPQVRGSTALDVDRAIVLVTSDAVARAAVEQAGVPLTPEELRDATRARAQGDAPLLRVTVEDRDRDVAISAAAALADAYLRIAEERATDERDSRALELREQLDEAEAEIGTLGQALGETEDPTRVAALEGQQDAALRRATVLEQARAELTRLNTDPGQVVEPAALDDAALAPGASLLVPAAGLLGLLLGAALALVVDRVDRRVWDADDVARATGNDRVVVIGPKDLVGDGLRTGGGHRRLRALVAPRDTATTVLLTSHDPDVGAGVAAGLAAALAGAGRPVLLLDAADRDAFGLPAGDLDGWLAGRTGLQKAARSPDGVPGLRVLRGQPSTELVGSATLRQLLEAPSTTVLVHVPGGSEAGDAIALAEAVDHVVVVATRREDRADDVARTERWLGRDSRRPPTVVLAG